MENSLILDSLRIDQFRVFRHLSIEHLSLVNLIVGENNVGKSCLLEALWLYARRGSLLAVWDLLESRDEAPRRSSTTDVEDQASAIRYLFYGREEITDHVEPIRIGPVSSQRDILTVTVDWYTEDVDEEGRRELRPLQLQEYGAVNNLILGLVTKLGDQQIIYRLDRGVSRFAMQRREPKGIPHVFIRADGLTSRQVGQLWDSIALTDLEEDVLLSLRIIASEVERVNLVGDEPSPRERIPIVKVKGISTPLPLRSLGEGMNRMFGIALALVNAADGILLVDEIDSGLHYSVQPDLWRLIFEVAHRLNVQVFATSHSWDCIEAFQQAAEKNTREEGLLISLRTDKERRETNAILFDERKLGIATREEIEVR